MEENKIIAYKWIPIQGYEGLYEISDSGLVRSVLRETKSGRSYGKRIIGGRILKQNTDKDGYKQVCLCKNGIKSVFRVHRLVAMSFISNPQNLPMVNHKNEDKSDNKGEKLEWCSVLYNNHYQDGYRQSRFENVRKSVNQFDANFNLIKRHRSIKDAALSVNGNRNTITRRARMKSRKPYCGSLWFYN